MELSLEDLRRAWAVLPVVKVKQMCRDGGVLVLEHPKDLGFFCMEYTYTERARPTFKFKGDTSISSWLLTHVYLWRIHFDIWQN